MHNAFNNVPKSPTKHTKHMKLHLHAVFSLIRCSIFNQHQNQGDELIKLVNNCKNCNKTSWNDEHNLMLKPINISKILLKHRIICTNKTLTVCVVILKIWVYEIIDELLNKAPKLPCEKYDKHEYYCSFKLQSVILVYVQLS